jgi:hypothetical protein
METQNWTSRVLAYVRAHKAQVVTVAAVVVGLVARYVPAFPADDVLHAVGALLSLV